MNENGVHVQRRKSFSEQIRQMNELVKEGRSLLESVEKAEGSATQSKSIDPTFSSGYLHWYYVSRSLVEQVAPDSAADFASHYDSFEPRTTINAYNYMIRDYLLGRHATLPRRHAGRGLTAHGYTRRPVIARVRNQVAILEAAQSCFSSALYNLRQLLQADLFDSELEQARELNRQGFARGAGAIAGVVLERHLRQVCAKHSLSIQKAKPTLGDLGSHLKKANILDMPRWRLVQHLGDLRNQCCHDSGDKPNMNDVSDLISGVEKITKEVI